MNLISSNTSSADPEIQRQYAARQAVQQTQPVQGPRMVQGNTKRLEEDRGITHAAEGDAFPSQPWPEAGSDMRVAARSEAVVVTPLPANLAMPVTREGLNNAIRSNDLETIRRLLETGSIDLYFFDAIYELPLTVVARYGNSDAVRLLLQAGADFKIVDWLDRMALKSAAQQADPGVFMCMCEYGADIHAKDRLGKTLLMHAAGSGSVAIVAILLSLGADIRAKDKKGETALRAAAIGGHREVRDLLFEAETPIFWGTVIFSAKSREKTGLMYAAGGGSKAIVQKLLSMKVDVNFVDKSDMTALMFAAKNGKLDILALLLQHGALVNLRGTQVKNATVTAIEQGNIPVLERLLNYCGEPYDLQGTPSLLVSDMLMHRALLKREVLAAPLTQESLDSFSAFVLPELSANKAVHEELAQIFETLQICSPITEEFNKQMFDSGKQMQALAGIRN